MGSIRGAGVRIKGVRVQFKLGRWEVQLGGRVIV